MSAEVFFYLQVEYCDVVVICLLLLWFQRLADGVIPNEYGINPEHKLIIGAKVRV